MIDEEKKAHESESTHDNSDEKTCSPDKNQYADAKKLSSKAMLCSLDFSTLVTLLCTIVIAFSAFFTLVAICCQALIYFCQLKEMQKASHAATKAAKAAEDSVILAEKTRLDQRAWIGIKGAVLTKQIKPGERPAATVRFTNTGRTPAQRTKIRMWIVMSKPTSNENLERPEISEVSSGPLPVDAVYEANIEMRDALTQEQVDGLITDTYRLYVYGTIAYDDMFGRHWTDDFCFFNQPVGSTYLAPCSESSISP